MAQIIFSKNFLIYEASEDKYQYHYSPSFKFKINQIAIIGVYHGLIIDDQIDILVFIDKKGKKNFIPIAYDLESKSYLNFLEFFKIKNNFVTKKWREYENNNSYVLYPNSISNTPLYKNNLIYRIINLPLKTLKIKYIGEGILSDNNKNYLKKIELEQINNNI